ncbi:MAG: hypothetical protein IJZ42_05535 [Lachnospiraceae bacterium]|nr:hypothetical protein [Lachnospiraceae bacterium]
MKRIDTLKEKKIPIIITAIWGVWAIFFGLKFIEENYSIGLLNIYTGEISSLGQSIALVIACSMALIVIWGVVNFVYASITEKGKEREICICLLPILVLLVAYLLADVMGASTIKTYYVGDEKNIWDSAVRLYPFMFVYSGQLFLTCFFVLPMYLAPSIVKICFVSYTVGYTIWRVKKSYHNYAFLLYIFFASKPFLEMGIRVHRMHWYGILYLLIAIKLYFDSKEKSIINMKYLIILAFGLSVLTIWRREGIYLVVWGLVLLVLVYGVKMHNQGDFFAFGGEIKRIIIVFIMTELLVCLPELVYEKTLTSSLRDGDVVYQAFLVHMLDRPSFDRIKCEGELAAIDRYLDIEVIDRYNAECVEKYNDCYWAWSWYKEGMYYAPTGNWSLEGFEVVKKEVVSIVKKQPIVFLESRIIAFGMAARNSGYNLFLPLLITMIVSVWGICKKEYVMAVLALGVLGHAILTALLMPASYFKYFFQLYLFGYVFGFVLLLEFIMKNKPNVNSFEEVV